MNSHDQPKTLEELSPQSRQYLLATRKLVEAIASTAATMSRKDARQYVASEVDKIMSGATRINAWFAPHLARYLSVAIEERLKH